MMLTSSHCSKLARATTIAGISRTFAVALKTNQTISKNGLEGEARGELTVRRTSNYGRRQTNAKKYTPCSVPQLRALWRCDGAGREKRHRSYDQEHGRLQVHPILRRRRSVQSRTKRQPRHGLAAGWRDQKLLPDIRLR